MTAQSQQSEYRREYRRAHPEKFEKERQRARVAAAAKRAADPKWQKRTQFYQELVAMQGGEYCLICASPPPEGKRLHIDHDHVTDEIRGLLCPRCNRLLGAADDSMVMLQRAINYLDRGRFTGLKYADYQELKAHLFPPKRDAA